MWIEKPFSAVRWFSNCVVAEVVITTFRDSTLLIHNAHGPVVVAVIAVGMVQMAVHEIVHVIAVRHGFVAAARAVDVLRFVRTARVTFSAHIRVRRRNFQDMRVVMIAVRMQQMAVAQVIRVAFVFDGGVAALRAVLVVVVVMSIAFVHGKTLTALITVQHVLFPSQLRTGPFVAI